VPDDDRGRPVEPFAHPDLVALGRRLRARMDETLDAEQAAARAAVRRRRSLRDALLMLEDRADPVVLRTADGSVHRGSVDAVGVDHAEIRHGSTRHLISLHHIVSIEAEA